MALITAVVDVLDSSGDSIIVPNADGTRPALALQLSTGITGTYAKDGDTGVVALTVGGAIVGTTIVLPDPAIGAASFTNGEATYTSGRGTSTSGTPMGLLALPFPDLSPSLSFKAVRITLVGCDITAGSGSAGGLYDLSVNTGSALVFGAALATTTGALASPSIIDGIGGGTGAVIVWSAGSLIVAVFGPSVRVYGTTNITAGALYGPGGTLATGPKTLILTVNGVGPTTLTFDATGGTNCATEGAMLAAILSTFGLTATAGGSGGNKLVMTGTATGTIVVGGGTANAALGLTPGTYTPDSVAWRGEMKLVG